MAVSPPRPATRDYASICIGKTKFSLLATNVKLTSWKILLYWLQYRYHKSLLSDSNDSNASAVHSDDDNNEDDITNGSEGDPLTAEQPLPPPTVLGAQFILKTRDGKKLTQVAVDGIIADTKVIIESTLKNVEKKVHEAIGGVTMTDEQTDALKAIFLDDSVTNPFLGLDTEYKQEKFIRENFNYVVR